MKNKVLPILLSLIMVMTDACKKSDPDPDPVGTAVTVGAILDLSGDYSESGITGKAAIELAIEDLNQHYAFAGSPVRFNCTIADTHLDTNLTLQAAREMYFQGIRILVAGPNNSANTKAILPFLNTNRMVALTCFSSSPSLAVPDDFLYRLITDDNVQGKALVKMMQFDSVTALVPVWRTDTYGNGLYQTVKDKFQSAGGTVLNGISYQPGATNFGDMITLLTPQVTAAIASFGASHVAVILITYQEAADLLKAASDVGDLSRVKWYGCDANVQKSAISGDPVAGPFARVTRFLAPIMGIGTAGNLPATADDLTRKIAARTGLIPDAYSLSAYDAIQIVAKAYDVVRSTDADGIRMVIPWICESYNYLGVSRKLNDAGDLLTANYIFWTVVPSAGGYSWDSFSTYMADGDYILPR